MDEASVVLRARQMSRHLTAAQVQLPLTEFVKALNHVPDNIAVRLDEQMEAGQAGHTVKIAGKHCIIINANDPVERQRFTLCHELAHIVLGLATEHDEDSGPLRGRSPNEILCDVFAAELLLPAHLARPVVEESELEFASIERLARTFGASLSAAASRFASLCDRPCASVLIQNGIVRYGSRSRALQELRAFVRPRQRVSELSMAGRLIRSEVIEGPLEVSADEWFDDWSRGGTVLEDAKHFPRWNQTLALLWFEDEDGPSAEADNEEGDEEQLLRPLDGILPWPGRRRR